MTESPLVSVYLPTYNRLALLKRALQSIFEQSYENIEIIVVNDGSTDGTSEWLRSVVSQHPNLRLFENETPKGAPYSRNLAIKNANGELVTGLDDDDYFMPKRIEQLVRAYDPEFSFVCSGYYWSYGRVNRPLHNELMLITMKQQLHMNEASNQVLVSRERVQAVGGFDEEMVSCQDWELWTRLVLKYGPALRINEQSYVIDASHQNYRITDSPKRIDGFRQFQQRYSQFMDAAHKKSMAFQMKAAALEPISFIESVKLMTKPLWKRNLRYWLSCKFPYLTRKRLERLR